MQRPGVSVQLVIIVRGNVVASNNMTIPTTVKTLVFTNGNFSGKNSSTYTGVLYTRGQYHPRSPQLHHLRAGLGTGVRLDQRQPVELHDPEHLDAGDDRWPE